MIEFKTYEESRLRDQVNLAIEVMKDWKWISWYPNEKQLKESYSRESFTPDTRHYVYDGKNLVGFLSSAVEDEVEGVQYGSFHIPFIKKGYEHIEDELFEKTIETLKSKGVQAIRTDIMSGWGPMPRMLKKLGFEEKETLAMRTLFATNDLVDSNFAKPDYIIDLDVKEHMEIFIEAAHSLRNVPKENLERTYNYFIENDMIYSSVIVKINNEIVSYGMIYEGAKYEGDTIKRAFLSRIPVKEGKEHVFKEVFQYLVNRAKELDIDLIWHQIDDNAKSEMYSGLSIEFEPYYRLTLKLD